MAERHAMLQGEPYGDVTERLVAWSAGDQGAATAAFSALYSTLCNLARRALSGERTGHTLGTAGLISEAYLRLRTQDRVEWRNRSQFVAVAARTMRRILIDHARSRGRVKRGRSHCVVPLVEAALVQTDSLDGLVAIHDALEALAAIHRVHSQIIDLRFFGGMTHEEIAAYLGVSTATVERRWRLARAWLYQHLKKAAP
jgi:RNA polymerase sigma-70 factor (ECF subfamily)